MATIRRKKSESFAILSSPGPWPQVLINWLATLAVIIVFGLIMLFSASYTTGYLRMGDSFYYIKSQVFCLGLGLAVMLLFSRIDHRFLRRMVGPGYVVCIVMLIAVLFSAPLNGCRRWLRIGFTIQVSEIAKFEMILLTAHLAAKAPHLEKLDPASGRRVPAGQWLYQRIVRELIVPLLPLIPVVFLLMLEPHMSGIVLTTAICGTILLLGGSGGIITWAGGASAVLLLRTVLEHIDSIPYLQSRLDGWTHDLSKMTDQTLQSLYAIGSGGVTGLGLGNSIEKQLWLPESTNDFIFSVVCEELGFVGAVIVITSLGNGMQNYMNAQFEQLGSNLIQVMVYGRGEGGTRDVSTEDMYALVEKYPQYLSGVTPYVSATAKVRQGTEDFDRTSIYGVSEAFYRADTQKTMQGSSLENGRFLRYIDVERHQNVCVIGSYLAENAFRTDPLGQTISVSGVPYMVVGVLAESGDSTEGSVDDVIYIPYANAQRLGGGYGDMYLMTSTDRDTASAAKGIIENRLFKTYQSSDYYMVMTSAEMMDAMDSMLNTLMMILILIAAISLLVGGIGIMNIMLVSVTERTREIGIRKSLGAKCRDIRSQFIIEAGTTSAIGGAIGILLGILMANVLTNVIALVLGTGNDGFVAMPTAGGIGVAFGVSVAVGILFGYLPANKAAKLNPIDALRYD